MCRKLRTDLDPEDPRTLEDEDPFDDIEEDEDEYDEFY